jgi:hypothetical protein
MVKNGQTIGNVHELSFRDPTYFRAGELHRNAQYWEDMADTVPSAPQSEVLLWINQRVSTFPYFRHSKKKFKDEYFDSALPPSRMFKNNVSCRQFVDFIQKTVLNRLCMGAVSLVGRVGQVKPPHLVLPLTVEPTKPGLCHDARFLNLWMQDKPFTLDKLTDLPRYVSKDTYQTVLDDKSGYDHLLLSDDSHTYFGFEWAGWYFTYNTLPFGWKISPYVYHTTGLMAANYFRSMSIPCLLYIDDRHYRQLQISLNQGEYASLKTTDDRNFAAGQSAIFLVAFYLVRLGYFLALLKSIFIPRKEVPYLGFGADSSREVFHILPGKKAKFLDLTRTTLKSRSTSVKTLHAANSRQVYLFSLSRSCCSVIHP